MPDVNLKQIQEQLVVFQTTGNPQFITKVNETLCEQIENINNDNYTSAKRNVEFAIAYFTLELKRLYALYVSLSQLLDTDNSIELIVSQSTEFKFAREKSEDLAKEFDHLAKQNQLTRLMLCQLCFAAIKKINNNLCEELDIKFLSIKTIQYSLGKLTQATKAMELAASKLEPVDQNQQQQQSQTLSSNLVDLNKQLDQFIANNNKGLVKFNDYFRVVTRYLRTTFMRPILHDMNLLIEEARDVKKLLSKHDSMSDSLKGVLKQSANKFQAIPQKSKYAFFQRQKSKIITQSDTLAKSIKIATSN